MARSSATTVEEYLAELPDDRRAAITAVRDLVLRNLPKGYVETMNWGMISYEIPLSRFSVTYNKQPLSYAALASQKNYCSLHLMSAYANSPRAADLEESFRKAGKKLDMGKCCIRFKRFEDLEPDSIARVVAGTTPDAYIAYYESARKK